MIGIIGLGNMGYPMAFNLVKAGYKLKIYSRTMNTEKIKRLIAEGAIPAANPQDLAQGCSVVLLSLPSAKDSIDVVLGKKGLKNGLSQGSVLIETSTVPPKVILKIAEKLSYNKVEVLDAPVSGGRRRAESGELTIMVSGDRKTFTRCLPILKTLGNKIYYLGKLGNAETVKLLNSYLAITNLILSWEVCSAAKRNDIDLSLLHEIISNSTGSNWIWTYWVPSMIKGSEVGSTSKIALKDISYAKALLREKGLDTTLINIVHKRLRKSLSQDNEDLSHIFRDFW